MRYKQFFFIQFIASALIIYFLCFKTAAEEPANEDSISGGSVFFPDARISIVPSFSRHEENYISLSRYISIDAFRYAPFTCSFNTYEIFDYGTGDDKQRLKSIYYNMEYLNIRADTPYGGASFFIDHRCMNYVDIYEPPPRLRWYGYGARWQSRGMIIGEKDARRGLNIINSGNYLNFSASVRKPFYTEYYPYNYITDLMLRFDWYLTPEIIPYLSIEGEIFISERVEWNRAAEIGVRFGYGTADIIPYTEYSYVTDRDISCSGKKGIISAGIKIETSLSEGGTDSAGILSPRSSLSLQPELHLQGSYSKYIDDEEKNYRSDILAALNLIHLKKISLFLNSSLVHSSPRENSGLYPRYIDYSHEAGFSIQIRKKYLLEPLYRYSGFGEGNTVSAGGYNYHTAGVRFCTPGLKPGYINSRVRHNFSSPFTLLFNTEAELFAGWIPDNTGSGKSGIIEGTFREDLFNCKSVVSYISINAKVEKGLIPGNRKTYKEIKPELGFRLNSNLVFILFYQYIYRDPENGDYDLNREYHLAGVKIDI